MLKEGKKIFNDELHKYARRNIISKLEKQGIDYADLEDGAFSDLVADEMEILKSDSKKIGMGIGIGILISMLTGI